MNITGLQKMTLLDFPGKVACTVFTQGCNFRCPFCHNSDLLGGESDQHISQQALLDFLKKRAGLLEGVCFTGGEPTLQKGLQELMLQIKAMGYAVKLDTNGARPEVLKELMESGAIDYVAMDIKNCPSRYGETVGLSHPPMESIEESIRLLMNGSLPFEFRTTVVEEFHGEAAMEEICQWFARLVPGKKIGHYFLQSFVDRDSVLQSGLHTPNPAMLQRFSQLLAPVCENICIRGAD